MESEILSGPGSTQAAPSALWSSFLSSCFDWINSRKTKTLLVTLLVTVFAPKLGISSDTVNWIIGLGAAGVGAQGLADVKTGGSRATPR